MAQLENSTIDVALDAGESEEYVIHTEDKTAVKARVQSGSQPYEVDILTGGVFPEAGQFDIADYRSVLPDGPEEFTDSSEHSVGTRGIDAVTVVQVTNTADVTASFEGGIDKHDQDNPGSALRFLTEDSGGTNEVFRDGDVSQRTVPDRTGVAPRRSPSDELNVDPPAGFLEKPIQALDAGGIKFDLRNYGGRAASVVERDYGAYQSVYSRSNVGFGNSSFSASASVSDTFVGYFAGFMFASATDLDTGYLYLNLSGFPSERFGTKNHLTVLANSYRDGSFYDNNFFITPSTTLTQPLYFDGGVNVSATPRSYIYADFLHDISYGYNDTIQTKSALNIGAQFDSPSATMSFVDSGGDIITGLYSASGSLTFDGFNFTEIGF